MAVISGVILKGMCVVQPEPSKTYIKKETPCQPYGN